MTNSERNNLDQRLVEVDQDPSFQVDEEHETVDCWFCNEEHLGEVYVSPPDGFKIRWYCVNEERRGITSFV